jgi:hypothetical protein
MSAFEYWLSHKTEDYDIEIYMARDCDLEAIERGELEPGKLADFQMSFQKLVRGKTIKGKYIENALLAGEWLRDEIGYGPAKDALEAMNIPKDVPIWKLGQKG